MLPTIEQPTLKREGHMTVQISNLSSETSDLGPVIHMRVSDTLKRSDYEQFVPELESLIEQHGKIDLLVEFSELEGVTAGAVWEDTKFGIHHFNHIHNLAVLGGSRWEEWLALFAKPFTTAKVRYFDVSDYQAASDWVRKH